MSEDSFVCLTPASSLDAEIQLRGARDRRPEEGGGLSRWPLRTCPSTAVLFPLLYREGGNFQAGSQLYLQMDFVWPHRESQYFFFFLMNYLPTSKLRSFRQKLDFWLLVKAQRI